MKKGFVIVAKPLNLEGVPNDRVWYYCKEMWNGSVEVEEFTADIENAYVFPTDNKHYLSVNSEGEYNVFEKWIYFEDIGEFNLTSNTVMLSYQEVTRETIKIEGDK